WRRPAPEALRRPLPRTVPLDGAPARGRRRTGRPATERARGAPGCGHSP
ncbi:MAG: hypothetical protein AVDCRST_MAG07-3501, partial [uncultured Frankineae bacterium]